MLEQSIKNYIGELTVQLLVLQQQVADLTKERDELKPKEKR